MSMITASLSTHSVRLTCCSKNGLSRVTPDANGNVTDLASTNGSSLAHYEYSPFGAKTASTGTLADANPWQFSSKYFDAETGLNYYGYRYLSTEIGRWVSRDPIGEWGGFNSVGFVFNETIRRADALGLYDVIEEGGVSDDECKKGVKEALRTDKKLQEIVSKLMTTEHPTDPKKRKCLLNIFCKPCSYITSGKNEGGFYGLWHWYWDDPQDEYMIVIWSRGTWRGSSDPVRTLYHEVQHAAEECWLKDKDRPKDCKGAVCAEARARFCSGMSEEDSRDQAWLSARQWPQCKGHTEEEMKAWGKDCKLSKDDCYVQRPLSAKKAAQ